VGCCPRPAPAPRWDSSLVVERRKRRFELLEQRMSEQNQQPAILPIEANADE